MVSSHGTVAYASSSPSHNQGSNCRSAASLLYSLSFNTMFNTARLTLRAFHESDMPDLSRLANDAEVQQLVWDDYVVPRGKKFEESTRDWVRNMPKITGNPLSCEFRSDCELSLLCDHSGQGD